LVVADPAFYEVAQEGVEIEVDLARGKIAVAGRAFVAAEPSRIIQALANAGGIVPAIQRHGTEVFDKLTA
ncbi:MAG: 3-isopropylmalate dehydratase, partial [Myxococcales bacterium]